MARVLASRSAREGLQTRRLLNREPTFRLEADFTIEEPAIVGVMGPNGSGKTTLFELITGSNIPTAGEVLVSRPRHPPRAHR
jgi:ABC-type multidrug transport system ATPase subunit